MDKCSANQLNTLTLARILGSFVSLLIYSRFANSLVYPARTVFAKLNKAGNFPNKSTDDHNKTDSTAVRWCESIEIFLSNSRKCSKNISHYDSNKSNTANNC